MCAIWFGSSKSKQADNGSVGPIDSVFVCAAILVDRLLSS